MSIIDTGKPLIIDKKADWKVTAANTASALKSAEETADDLAARVKSLYKDEESNIQSARAAYDEARHAYNAISLRLRTLLILGKNTPTIGVDTDDAKKLLNKFEESAQRLISQRTNGTLATTKLGGFIPSLGDIGKVFDSIMGAIEWFKTRNDKERHELADILEGSEIRPWSEAGTPHSEQKQLTADIPIKKNAAKG